MGGIEERASTQAPCVRHAPRAFFSGQPSSPCPRTRPHRALAPETFHPRNLWRVFARALYARPFQNTQPPSSCSWCLRFPLAVCPCSRQREPRPVASCSYPAEPQNRDRFYYADTLVWRSTRVRSDCGTTRAPQDGCRDTEPRTSRTDLDHRARDQRESAEGAHYRRVLASALRGC